MDSQHVNEKQHSVVYNYFNTFVFISNKECIQFTPFDTVDSVVRTIFEIGQN